MLEVSDLSRAQDKLARFPPAYKQLVNLIRQGKSDARCQQELWDRKMHFDLVEKKGEMVELTVPEAVIVCANSLGVKEGTYEERRQQLGYIGVDFFGEASSTRELRHHTDRPPPSKQDAAVYPLPELAKLIPRVEALSSIERQRLDIYIKMKGQVTNRIATSAGLRNTDTFHSAISEIFGKIGVRGGTGHSYVAQRRELVSKAIASLKEPAK
jgi:hypothetical protein